MKRRTRLNRARGTPPPYTPPTPLAPPPPLTLPHPQRLSLVHPGWPVDPLHHASPGEQRRRFQEMLGDQPWKVTGAGPLTGRGELLEMYRAVQDGNNRRARRAAGAGETSWRKAKVIVWRDCWCLAIRDARTKRVRHPMTPPEHDQPPEAALRLHDFSTPGDP